LIFFTHETSATHAHAAATRISNSETSIANNRLYRVVQKVTPFWYLRMEWLCRTQKTSDEKGYYR